MLVARKLHSAHGICFAMPDLSRRIIWNSPSFHIFVAFQAMKWHNTSPEVFLLRRRIVILLRMMTGPFSDDLG